MRVRSGSEAWSRHYAASGSAASTNFNPESFVARVFLSRSPVRFLEPPLEGSRILDLGCGHGRHLPFLASLGLEVSALEVTPELVADLRDRFPDVEIMTGTAAHIPADDSTFDLVLACNSIYYLDSDRSDLSEHLHECARVLRPGGRIVVSLLGADHSLLRGASRSEDGSVHIRSDHLGARDGVVVRPYGRGDDHSLLAPFVVDHHGEIVETVADDVRHLHYFVATAPAQASASS